MQNIDEAIKVLESEVNSLCSRMGIEAFQTVKTFVHIKHVESDRITQCPSIQYCTNGETRYPDGSRDLCSLYKKYFSDVSITR